MICQGGASEEITNVDNKLFPQGVPQKSSTATITIQVTDENDEAPVFLQKIYRTTLSESQLSGRVITVSATDKDVNENTKLTYTLENSDLTFFSIRSLFNAGDITVFRVSRRLEFWHLLCLQINFRIWYINLSKIVLYMYKIGFNSF